MLRAAALLLAVLTGFAALVQEIAWQKYLAVLLGSHSEATATVLAVFLGGLALGYRVCGRWSRTLVDRAPPGRAASRLLVAYGALEAAIGVLALVFPWTFLLAQRVAPALPRSSEPLSFAVDVLTTIALIGVPATMMGGTVPLLTQALARDVAESTRIHAYVYGLNTAGACAGAIAGGFFLVPWWGLAGAVRAMGGLKVVAGLAYAFMARHAGGPLLEAPRDAGPIAPPRGLASCTVAAFLAGFAWMSVQTTLNRLGACALGSSPYTFAMVVGTFVACIALGSLAVTRLRRVRPWHLVASQWGIVAFLVALYGPLGDVTYWVHRLRVTYPDEPGSFFPFLFAVLLRFALFAVVPLGLGGATLPLLFHHVRTAAGQLGNVAGRLYAWNTAGSLAGALLGGYALLFWIDLHAVYRIAVLALAVGAALLTRIAWPQRRWVPVAALAVLVGVLAAQGAWEPRRLSAGLYRQRSATAATARGPDAFFESHRKRGGEFDVVRYEDDPSVSVAVIRGRGEGLAQALLLNGKSDGDLPGDNRTTGMLALLPALFAESPDRAFVVGLGTGMTAGVLGSLDATDEVLVAEISRGVVRAAGLFEAYNHGVLANPKIRIRRTDAYRELLRGGAAWDVIVSEPSNPWVEGVEMLYSAEFLRAARGRLAPGGVYAQWFHTYETDDATVELVLRTFREAFDRVSVWSPASADLILLGFAGDASPTDLDALERRFAWPDYRARFDELSIDSLPELLAHEVLPLGVAEALPLAGDTHTILHPVLSHRAARAFHAGGQARLPPSHGGAAGEAGRRNSLLRRFREREGPAYGWQVRSRVISETCHYLPSEACATLFAEWAHEEPGSERLPILLEAARRDPALATALAPERIGRLARLFDPTPPPDPSPPAEVERHYHHAAPFAAWAR